MLNVLLLTCVLSACEAALFDDELYRDALDPELCGRQLSSMRRAEFSDASFRTPDGLLTGNLASLGNYHQCLAINQDFSNTNIQGKYCLIQAPMSHPTVRIPSLAGVSEPEKVTWTEVTLSGDQMQQYAGQSLSLGVCVPKPCTVEEVLAPYTEHPVIGFNFTEQYCRLPDDKPFVAADYVATIILSLLGLLTLISTAYELRHIFILRRDPEQASELLRTCSLYTNTRRVLAVGKASSLDCIDGIRSLTILWIIFLHAFLTPFYYSKYIVNHDETLKWILQLRALWLVVGPIAVDTFFALSGLLLVYTSAKKMKQMSLLKNLHLFYLNRYLRLFPLLAGVVLLQASLLHRVSDGPLWPRLEAGDVQKCRRYWWSALLHLQNIVNSNEMCVPYTWYLSVDMQLYIISPLVLYWVLGSRRAARAALAVAILASLAGTFASCAIFDFPTSKLKLINQPQKMKIYEQYYYFNTLTRSPPFFIGMLFGYILHLFRDQQIKLSKWIVFTCYTLMLGMFIYPTYIQNVTVQPEWDNYFADVINNTFRRACWSLALCWLIFACVHGYGGPVNWFLSLRLWKFVSRISYAMYLFHFSVVRITTSAAVVPVYFNMENLFSSFANCLMFTVLWSTAMCVLVEEPALTLQRIFLGGSSKPHRNQNKDGNDAVPPSETNNEKYAQKLDIL